MFCGICMNSNSKQSFCANCMNRNSKQSFSQTQTCCRPSPLCECQSDVDDIGSSIGNVWICQNSHRQQPQTINTVPQKRGQVATVDRWHQCSLARQRQLAVPAAHARKFLTYCYTDHLVCYTAVQHYPVFCCGQLTLSAPSFVCFNP